MASVLDLALAPGSASCVPWRCGEIMTADQLDKETLLYIADLVSSMVRHGEAGEIEEMLRRLAAALPSKPNHE